jgi:hypothetical protein
MRCSHETLVRHVFKVWINLCISISGLSTLRYTESYKHSNTRASYSGGLQFESEPHKVFAGLSSDTTLQ